MSLFSLALSIAVTRLIGNRCHCGNTVAPASIPGRDDLCVNVCSGIQQSVCGGKGVLNLYEANNFASTASSSNLLVSSNSTTNLTNPTPPKPPTPPEPPAVVKVPGWTYRGCWTDNPYHRTLISHKWKGLVTPERCAQICKGYTFFALEYSNE